MSSIEPITMGVPVFGIPIFSDQRKNESRTVFSGYGIRIDFNSIMTESLTWAIQEAIETPKYVLVF
jgi:UDP:flavonoid glycosyltransferase YjiC (YdhE family)